MKNDKALKVVAHKLRFLLPDNMVATISTIQCDGRLAIEGLLGDQPFCLPLRDPHDILKIFEGEKELPVVLSEKDSEIFHKAMEQTTPNAALKAAVVKNIPCGNALGHPVQFTPPSEPAANATRSRITSKDRRGQELREKFDALTPKPHFKKKKLSDAQRKDQADWEKMREIARSYLLAGDYGIIQQWIEHLEKELTSRIVV